MGPCGSTPYHSQPMRFPRYFASPLHMIPRTPSESCYSALGPTHQPINITPSPPTTRETGKCCHASSFTTMTQLSSIPSVPRLVRPHLGSGSFLITLLWMEGLDRSKPF
ncbi:UNVERIFIED_CONTAM: hypothetical protein Slati_2195400 [Sesamum latifolium]|uniref:Uncharacterized protein n=1 Tax=Sesamum latifolium TaxID=2727402 RepID=A0AAW2WSM7_9LAMI